MSTVRVQETSIPRGRALGTALRQARRVSGAASNDASSPVGLPPQERSAPTVGVVRDDQSMRYRGLNGTVEVDADGITLTRSGLRGRMALGGLPAVRRLDLTRVRGAVFKPATALVNGHITFWVDGRAVPDLKTIDVPQNSDSVMFTRRMNVQFEQLASWLNHVGSVNEERSLSPHNRAGVDRDPMPQQVPAPEGSSAAAVVKLRWVAPDGWPATPSGWKPAADWLPDPTWPNQDRRPTWIVVGPAGQRSRFAGEPPAEPAAWQVAKPSQDERERWAVSSDRGRLQTLNAAEGTLSSMRRGLLETEQKPELLGGFETDWTPEHPANVELRKTVRALVLALTEKRDLLLQAIVEDRPVAERYFATTSIIGGLLTTYMAAAERHSTVVAEYWESAVQKVSSTERAAYLGGFSDYSRAERPSPAGGAAGADWVAAEVLAAATLRQCGYSDARVTTAGSDGGIDVTSSRIAAQVKYTGSPVGRPLLQQLQGAASGRATAFFSRSGYTSTAKQYADEVGMALFVLALPKRVTAVNDPSRAIARQA